MRVPDSNAARLVLEALRVTPAAVPIVNDPAVPAFKTPTMVPVSAPHVALAGIVAVPPDALESVTSSPASAVPNVYVLDVCALIVAVFNAVLSAAAVSTEPAVKFAMPILP